MAVALTIAGSDSGGGAGIQADLRTFSTLGVFGTSAITASTSQNPLAVKRVDAVPVEGVVAQIEAVRSAFTPGAVKTGMLFDARIAKAVAEALSKREAPLVVDPVAVSTSGSPLLKASAVSVLRSELLPLATWATPNIPEAGLLLKSSVEDEYDMIEAALEFNARWGCSCVLKAGHLKGSASRSVDVVCHEGELYKLSSPRLKIKDRADHGTGCTFSAALAALLARGETWDAALLGAKAFVFASLAQAVRLAPGIMAMFPPEPDSLDSLDIRLERIS